MVEHRKKALRPKSVKQDDSIMGTNNSSIVSKRSVERLYYPNEPHFFRYFVKKPQRRAPLINRGYWLRMQAIDFVVRQFLIEASPKKKVVVNLGCGYDPLPWQCWTRYSKACEDVLFVDIDYKDLMLKKRQVVKETPELNQYLHNVSYNDSGVLLQSDEYLQIGCDLRDLVNLSDVLRKAVDIEKSIILFTAEVSITYMNLNATDALIKWAAQLPEARFCVLEQLLPEGPDHPFAKTMMAHFQKLQTPLGSVETYPTTAHQKKRYKNAGWAEVTARNLWDLWSSDDFISKEERNALDLVEPFDEWEEFALFGCHYVLSVARSRPSDQPPPSSSSNTTMGPTAEKIDVQYTEYDNGTGCRRFSSPLNLRSFDTHTDVIGNYAGYGLNNRLDSCDTYTALGNSNASYYTNLPQESPGSRMCHTVTDLGNEGSLLVGGRGSPDHGLADCWLYHKWLNVWERLADLPCPRYRHSAVSIGYGAVLVLGGKCNSTSILESSLIWTRRGGWVECATAQEGGSDPHPAVFGAVLLTPGEISADGSCHGILAGGVGKDGTVQETLWSWNLHLNDSTPHLEFRKEPPVSNLHSLSRFGASITGSNGRYLIVGGVKPGNLFSREDEIISATIDHSEQLVTLTPKDITDVVPRPLLVGCTVATTSAGVLVMGGGAVCFSFGTYWNQGFYLVLASTTSDAKRFLLERTIQPLSSRNTGFFGGPASTETAEVSHLVGVARRSLASSDDFSSIRNAAQPVVLEGLRLGSCTELWTSKYLEEKIDVQRQVVIHQATERHMDFTEKNFAYVTQSFGDFLTAVEAGEKLYLRCLASEKPSELPAELARDFPAIASDFQLPAELSFVTEKMHSSVLRISGPVDMWLHYDVMSNVLCQIRGTKRLLLFPPLDVKCFDFAAGASSSGADVFKMLQEGRLTGAHPHEVILRPGDLLFIPALWLHTASPADGISIAVNVFFRGLSHGYAGGKDVYGNRDLQAYEKGRQDITKIANSFDRLPEDIRQFYLARLVKELSQKAGLE